MNLPGQVIGAVMSGSERNMEAETWGRRLSGMLDFIGYARS